MPAHQGAALGFAPFIGNLTVLAFAEGTASKSDAGSNLFSQPVCFLSRCLLMWLRQCRSA
jgi:hypothetical protein